MAEDLILAIDQGTSSTKSMLVDQRGRVVAQASVAVGQDHPQPGWVEQDAEEIWASVRASVRDCVTEQYATRVVGVALSVQRETVVLWDRQTGRAVAPALGWQDQRTADRATVLEQAGRAPEVLARTGLPLDPMFSALKAGWLLDEHDPERTRTGTGTWCVGTVDAWLLAHFASKGDVPVTEIGNASRTQLLDIDSGDWDDSLLGIFGVPKAGLPRVVASVGPFPAVRDLAPVPDGVPVLAVLADSHAALFAHAGWRPGVVKATYGTGSSVMALGPRASAASGVCATVAWQVDEVELALEANIRSTGRTLTWLADLLDVDVDLVFDWAGTASSDGVVVVPAFGGLGAPWWDRDAVPLLSGFSLGTGREQVARAALESIAFQVDDALTAFAEVSGPLAELACDGGMTRSVALMQLQADVSGRPVGVSATANLSALGAAHLAGLRTGWWTWSELENELGTAPQGPAFEPRIDDAERDLLRSTWKTEVARARGLGQHTRADEKAT
ncbi:MAG: FGGY family carbohydrate kinase [Marmoricola sp.]